MKRSTTSAMAQVSMVALFMVFNVSLIVSACMAYIGADYWPDMSIANVSYIATASAITVAPFAFISGILAGRKVGFRPLAIGGIALMVIGGVMPVVNHGFTFVIVSRVIFGVGQGLCQPLGNVVIVRCFKGQRAATLQGVGNVVANGSAIAFQLLSSFLVVYSVDWAWYLTLVMIIPLVIVMIWLPEPGKDMAGAPEGANGGAAEGAPAKKEKLFLPAPMWVLTAGFSIMFIGFYPMLLSNSAIILGEDLGPALYAGIAGTMYTVGGVVAGPVYAFLYPRLKRAFFPVCIAIWIVGMAIFVFGHSVALIFIGNLIAGVGVFTLWPGCNAYFGQILPENSVATACGIWSAIFAFCAFLASPLMSIVESVSGSADPRVSCMIGLVLMIAFGILWALYMVTRKNYGERLSPKR